MPDPIPVQPAAPAAAPAAPAQPTAPAATPAAAPAPAAGSLLASAAQPAAPAAPANPAAQAEPAKPADSSKPADPAAKPADPAKPASPPAAAPDEYKFALPEGVAELDQTMVAKFTPIAKELGLSQEKAQSLVNLYGEAMVQAEAAAKEAHSKQIADWRQEVQAWPNADETIGNAKRAVDRYASPEVKALLEGSWLGDNPQIISFLAKIGADLREDAFVGRSASSQPASQDARSLFPNSKMNP